jgi:hypothetical protein
MSIALVLAVVGLLIFVWSYFRYQRVFDALIDTFPLELRDDHTSRFAIHPIALSPSTPLALQADYVKSEVGVCLAMLAGALSSFLYGNVVLGLTWSVVWLVGVVVTFNSWKAYAANRDRRISDDEKEQ